MDLYSNTLLVLAVILFFGLIIPQFFKRLHLPFTTSLIILGAIMGPYGMEYVEVDNTMKVFGFLGATFFMLLAGFETETLHIRESGHKAFTQGFWGAVIPFLTGIGITKGFGYDWPTSVFIGILFLSSSILLAFSQVKNLGIKGTPLGNRIESTVVIHDLASALLIFLVFKYVDPHHRFPLPILLGLLISSVVILRMFVPEIIRYFFQMFEEAQDEYESKTRLLLALLFLIILIYSALDVEPIIAAFLVGFILSEIPETKAANEKIGSLGYVFFIPIYLFIIGLDYDWSLIFQFDITNYLILSIAAGAFISKFTGGFLDGKMGKHSRKESILIGLLGCNKLTITISGAFIGLQLNIIDQNLYTAIITVSLLSLVLVPLSTFILQAKKQENASGH